MYDRELIFSGRICSLDRFTGESPEKFIDNHRDLFGKYLDCDVLCGILTEQEEYKVQFQLLERARLLSLSESDVTTRTTTTRNLTSVFSRLSVTEDSNGGKMYYDFEEFHPEKIFPKEKPSRVGLADLRTHFEEEIYNLQKDPPDTYEAMSIVFDRICQKYLWGITSSDYEGEDISLYDHLKITEAILSCYVDDNSDSDKNFCLLMGDFSGIQKYIFGIASLNQSGLAKRLRARSFYVDIMIRVFSQYVIDLFSVGRENILMQTGGKFYILLPVREKMNEKLNHLRRELDYFLYEKFRGTVSMNLAWVMTGDHGLRDYSQTVVTLNEILHEQQNHAFSQVLQSEGEWCEDSFVIFDTLAEQHLCPGCGAELIFKEKDRCPTCEMQLKMGTRLAGAKYIVYEKKEKSDNFHIFKDYYINITNQKDFADACLVEALYPLKEDMGKVPVIQKFMANHIPIDKSHSVKTFSEIAEASIGMDKLAVLKADVDVLGFLFSEGLRNKNRHYGTISRVNTMSRMLEAFFSGYLNQMLEKDDYSNVYTVFSGGDDLFLIGPWDGMPRLALAIHDAFREFAAHNPCVTLSAAVILFDHKEHVAYMAERSEEQLECAKNQRLEMVYPERTGRNSIVFMNDLFSWEDYRIQLNRMEMMKELILRKQIDTGILNRIRKYSEMYRRFLIDKDIMGLMFEPLLFYDRVRNYPKAKDDPLLKEFLHYVDEMQKDMANYHFLKKDLYFAKTTVKCALNATRRERNHGTEL